MTEKKQILLIDSHALVHRAYHAFPPLMTAKKELVNAVYGFTMMLLNSIKKYEPEYIVCAFDEKPTERTKKFVGYKAHRPKTDKELKDQLSRVHEVVDALGIPAFSKKGFEADDVLGTLVQKYLDGEYGDESLELIVVSGDKDLLQLLTKDVHVSLPGRGFADPKIWKVADFKEKYGFAPKKLVDFKGLKGDPSDNIPGVKGVGDKTATALIKQFGTVEDVFKKFDKVPDKFKKKLDGQEDVAKLSKDLATIVRDMDLDFDLDKCRVKAYDREKALTLFRELNFSSLVRLLPVADGDEDEVTPKETKQAMLGAAGTVEVKTADGFACTLIRDAKDLGKMMDSLDGAKEIVVDAESDTVDPIAANMVGFSICDGKHSWYIPTRDVKGDKKFVEEGKKRYGKEFSRLFEMLESDEVRKIGHNLKFDKHIFLNEGIDLRGVLYDTMIAAYVLNPGARNLGLKSLAFDCLGIEMTPFEDLFTKKPDLYSENVDKLAEYCCMDSYVTWKLKVWLEGEISSVYGDFSLPKGLVPGQKGEWSLLDDLEIPIVDILIQMERSGIKVDKALLKKLDKRFDVEVQKVVKEIYALVGHEFNPASPAQVGKVLFEELGLSGKKKTKTGFSTNDSVLKKLVNAHPVVPLIRKYREISKLKSTYVKGLLKLVNKKSGRIHTSFNQTVTATGRLSSSKPNLQNIPTRTDIGTEIRRCFVAEKGYAFVSLDYSQVELRVMAQVSKDPGLIEVFEKGMDVHKATASVVFDVPIEEVTKKQRRTAKTVNFAVLYGMTDYGLSDLLQIPQSDAKKYIERFFDKYPKICEYFADVIEGVKENGYVETLFGRRRKFVYEEGYQRIQGLIREANNTPMQGTAADIMKLAMIEVDNSLDGFDFEVRTLLQVHDELVFEVELQKRKTPLPLERLYEDKHLREFVPKMIKKMENVVKLNVLLDVDAEVGYNWADKIEVEIDERME